VVVSGATSSGKTTMLNALAGLIPVHERIITIEDTAELRLHADHVVRLESRQATADGVGAVSVRDLVRTALRLRPDRIVVGEVRGPEAFDMVQALNTGHDGSLSTVHANSPEDAIRRVASLASHGAPGQPLDAIVEQVRSSLDAVVQVARLGDGRRAVVEVVEVAPPGAGGAHVRPLAIGDRVLGRPVRSRAARAEVLA
jgi:pilus assembly protein CpaF